MEPNPQRTAQPSWTFKPDRPDSTLKAKIVANLLLMITP